MIKAGLKQAPMLINQSHLRDINHEKSAENRHFHGIDESIIVQLPNLIKNPVAIYDSISEDNKENSICVLTNKTDKEENPIIISITKSNDANKYYTLSLDVVKTKESNYATSMYGKDDFLVHLKDILDKDALLYADKSKINNLIQKNSQNANSDVKLELLERLDTIGYNKIIHQSRNLVNTYSMQNSKNDAKEYKLQEPVDIDAEYGSYVAAVEAENAEIKELNESLKREIMSGRTLKTNPARVNEVVERIRKDYNSSVNLKETAGAVQEIWKKMVGLFDKNLSTEVFNKQYEKLFYDLAKIGKDIAENTKDVDRTNMLIAKLRRYLIMLVNATALPKMRM